MSDQCCSYFEYDWKTYDITVKFDCGLTTKISNELIMESNVPPSHLLAQITKYHQVTSHQYVQDRQIALKELEYQISHLGDSVNKFTSNYKQIGKQYHRPPIDGMPGLHETVKHPVHGRLLELEDVIISLNDTHGWTREQIADWLDTLDIDLTFKTETSV